MVQEIAIRVRLREQERVVLADYERAVAAVATVAALAAWLPTPDARLVIRGRGAEPVRLETVTYGSVIEMLVVLAQSPGVVYSRRELLERLRGGADYREPRTIDVHVRHLREKIERDPSDPELILTMRGAGYRFRSE